MYSRSALWWLAAFALLTAAAPAHADWTWTKITNTMSDQRWAPSYCLLAGGKDVLICGGYSFQYGWCVPSADLFDEDRQIFLKVPSRLTVPRDFATATLLRDGSVLIAGGFNDSSGSLNSAEFFNPLTRKFHELSSQMLAPRELHTATLLNDGTVLIVGGLNLHEHHTLNTGEIFDPSTQSFNHMHSVMTDDRFGQSACLLTDGRVLIAGGTSALFGHNGYAHTLSSAEIYDPTTGTFRETKFPMTIPRDRPTTNLLPDGKVLVAGGQGPGGQAVKFSEIFDPATEIFTKVDSQQGTDRMAHNSSTLANGNILLTGGWASSLKATTASTEEYVPSTQTFIPEHPLPFSSHDAVQVIFPDGEVLVAGGKSVKSDNTASALAVGAYAHP